MGISSSKVDLMSEPPSKHGFFSFMKGKCSKTKDFDNKFCKHNTLWPHLWSGCGNEKRDNSETRNRHANKCEEKFRTRFDPRITARYCLYHSVELYIQLNVLSLTFALELNQFVS